MVNKEEDYWTKEEREKVQRSLKAKTIITIALGIDEFFSCLLLRVCKINMGNIQVTHEGKTGVKRARMKY